MKQYLKFQSWSLSMLALIISFTASAQSGEGYYGPAINTGQLSHGVGTGVQAFSILTGGSFNGYTNGRSVDNFVGPNAVAGPQEIGGIIAPAFDTLQLNNGASSAFNITNTAGMLVNGSLAFNNGITTTLRATRAIGLAGAIQFLGSAVYTPALTPALGSDVRFTDGYVSKVNPAAFVFPVGYGSDLRTITASGTGTYATAWSSSDANTAYVGALPSTVSAISTHGYWEWSATNASTVTVSIPEQTTFATTASSLLLVGYNGTAWTSLGGSFTSKAENSNNTAVVNVPANITAIAVATAGEVRVNVKVYLQGATIGGAAGLMRTDLNDGVVLTTAIQQPYNTAAFGNYNGMDSVAGNFFTANPTIVDWVFVELRSAADFNVVEGKRAAFVTSNGTLIDTDGTTGVKFPNAPGNYFISINHRNHLSVLSPTALALSSTSSQYDFTTGIGQAMDNGNLNSMVQVGGKWAMWAGDINHDQIIDGSDFSYTKISFYAGYLGEYRLGDITFDTSCDGDDYSLVKTNFLKGPASPLF